MSNNNRISIGSGGDESFAMPMAVSLYSILRNYRGTGSLIFYIMDGGMSRSSVDKINRILKGSKVVWLKPDMSMISDLPENKSLNRYAYMRLLLPNIIKKEAKNIIYIDADTVTNASIDNLMDCSNSEYAVSAVRDYGGAYAFSSYALKRVYKEIDVLPQTPMFNSGVMVINTKRWNQINILERCIEYLNKFHAEVILADQEALNAVINGKWHSLPWKWNVQVGALQNINLWEDTPFRTEILQYREDLLSQPSIAHFIGGRKPWKAGLTNPCRPLFTLYLRESGWFTKAEFARWYFKWFTSSISYICDDLGTKINNIIRR